MLGRQRKLPSTPEEIASDMATKDRRFKVAIGVFMIAVITNLVVLLVVIINFQAATKKEIDGQLKGLSNHIDCIVSLFQTPRRTAFYISNIQNCKLVPVNNPATPDTSTPASNSTGQGASTSPKVSSGGINVPSAPPSQPPLAVAAAPSQPPMTTTSPPPPTPTHQPLNVLGIPTCASLLNLCITR